jgi:hypothetical protein
MGRRLKDFFIYLNVNQFCDTIKYFFINVVKMEWEKADT